MRFLRHLCLLTFCLFLFGSATPSIYLDYSIESLVPEEILIRQTDKSDLGYDMEILTSPYHPDYIITKEDFSNLKVKGQQSYSSKSAYY